MNQEQSPNPSNTKQQVIDAIKKANNVLITVSQNPSVDQLSSLIGLSLILNKLNKHAIAIFSGSVPSTIEFLQPEKMIETNTDSLRDFIISLDRDKADKLRYKVEDDVVRIYITPYKTSLSQNDLVFSQGDFNVDVVIALGVDSREHLDLAIMQQGRILHDAVVIGLSVGEIRSGVGSINLHDKSASSISEMVALMTDSLQTGLLDEQISTALLTGIVAETDRFRNEKTTARSMSVSAQLMSSGANQQLVTEKVTAGMSEENSGLLQPSDNMTQVVGGSEFDVQGAEEDNSEASVSLHVDPNLSSPAVQLPGEESDEIKKIKIDEAGIIHDDFQQESTQDKIINKPHKVIQPLSNDLTQKTDTPSYIYTPPERGGTLTAEAQDYSSADSASPLTNPLQPETMLSHEQPDTNMSSDLPEAPDIPVVQAPPILESSAPAAQSVVADPYLPQFPSQADSPLQQSEVALDEAVGTNDGIDQDAARRAVMEAVTGSSTGAVQPPITDLNSQPMNLSAPEPNQNPLEQLAPPPLPPPITPIPGQPMQNYSPQQLENPQQPQAQQQGNTPFNLPPPQ